MRQRPIRLVRSSMTDGLASPSASHCAGFPPQISHSMFIPSAFMPPQLPVIGLRPMITPTAMALTIKTIKTKASIIVDIVCVTPVQLSYSDKYARMALL